jgi:RHS repeat-associated protein
MKTINMKSFYKLLGMVLVIETLLFPKHGYAVNLSFENFQSSSAVISYPAPSFFIQQDLFASLPATTNHSNYSVKNTVLLYIDHAYPSPISASFYYIYEIEITKTDASLAVTTQVINLPIQFNPNANPGISYKDKVAFTFMGAHKVALRILSIKSGGVSVPNPEDNIILKAVIDIERYWTFTPSATSCVAVTSFDLNADAIQDELELTWPTLPGAESYDLEWTWIDNYDMVLGTPKATSSLQWNFKENSTRISLASNIYRLNLVFERGYIVFRVRGVGTNISNPTYPIPGNWSRPDAGTNPAAGSCSTSCYNVVQDHRYKFNWQYTGLFSEGGKKKEVSTYYDGSLRDRQTVTRMNTDNVALVGETIYDFNGRKAINILPVPVQSPALDYNANLNVNSSNVKYTYNDFDLDVSACQATAGAMGTQSGASRYFSSSNPLQTGKNAYIPNANGYPFVQIEYTSDMTGNLRRNGGLGNNHQLGSNHEVKYFYGKPLQVELDRLFGSEVGYASHYKKNLIYDPNGQLSITYLDQEGRVVASAMTGQNPANLSPLASKPGSATVITGDLFAKDANGLTIENYPNLEFTQLRYYAQYLVTEPGNHTFTYGMTPLTYEESCLGSICLDCIYDLTIQVRDECGILVTEKIVKIGGPTLDKTCGDVYFSQPLNPFTLNLSVGNYHITKILSINKEAFNYYLTEYLNPANNSCLPNPEQLLLEEKAKLDYEGCDITCEECAEALGSMDDFVVSGKGTADAWKKAYEECMAPCESANMCESIFGTLLADVSPGGQYAEYYDTLKNTVSVSDFPLSLLNYDNYLPDGGLVSNNSNAAYWRNPKKEIVTLAGTSTLTGYYEEDGITRSVILLTPLPNDQGFIPEATSTFVVDGYTYAYPENLVNIRDFTTNWKPSWAYSLVPYHPEYCYYKWCEANINKANTPQGLTSAEFDQSILGTFTWANANSKFPNIHLINTLVNLDPYFNAPGRSTQKTALQNKMTNYEGSLSALQASAVMVKCPGFFGTSPAMPATCTDYMGSTTTEKDQIWNNYKMLYLSYRTILIENDANQDVYNDNLCNKGINNCIGEENFIFSSSLISKTKFATINQQTCSYNTYSLFMNKVRRFNLVQKEEQNMKDKAEFNKYYYRGICPLDDELLEMINSLGANGKIITPVGIPEDLYKYNTFTPKINEALYAPLPLTTFYNNWQWAGTISFTNDLNITITPQTPGPASKNINLVSTTFLPLTGVTLTKVVKYEYISYTPGGFPYPYKFTIHFSATNGKTYQFTGYTNITLKNCKFTDDCRVSDFGNSLANLMSGLSDAGQLVSGVAVNLETTYAPFATRFIRNNIGSPSSNNLEWIQTSAGNYKIRQVGSVTPANDINIQFNTYTPGTFTSGMINQIKYFTDFQYDVAAVQTGFSVTGWYSLSGLPPYQKVVIKGTVSRGALAHCYEPVPLTCDNKELQATRDFEAFLREIVMQHPITNTDLLKKNSFTRLMEAYMGKNVTTTLLSPTWGNNAIDMVIEGKNGGGTTLNKTIIRLYRKNLEFFTSNGALSNVTELGYLHTNGKGTFQGVEHSFTAVVRFPGGTTEQVFGFVSTVPIQDCENCEPPPVATVEACNTYDMYKKEVLIFNMNHPMNPVPLVPNDPLFPCLCVKNYLYYLKAYALDQSVFTTWYAGSCTNPGGPPVSIHQFNTNGCRIQICNECQLWTETMGIKTWAPGSQPANTLQNSVGAFNAYFSSMMPLPSWYTTLYISPDSIAQLQCECALKYAVYINRWVNVNNAEGMPYQRPDYMPMTLGQFVKQGCDAECWWEYSFYRTETVAAGGMPVDFSKTISCGCWLNFAADGNLQSHTALTVKNYCNPSLPSRGYNIYAGVDFTQPLDIRQKFMPLAENLTREFSYCTPEPFPEGGLVTNGCSEWLDNIAKMNADRRYQDSVKSLIKKFTTAYYAKCMSAVETFSLQYLSRDYHYTLYYYDQASNLVRTVPPSGVKLVTDPADLAQINSDRTNREKIFYTTHTLNSVYEFNSLNQKVKQSLPDHDKMDRWYLSNSSGLPAGFVANDMVFTDPNNGQLIGSLSGINYIYTTTDGGATWERKRDIYTQSIIKVGMADNNVGYAVGKNGLFLKTTDAGLNWQILALDNKFTTDLTDIVVRKNGVNYEGILCGVGGVFERFVDNAGAFTWTTISLPGGVIGTVQSISFKETVTGAGYAIVNDNSNATLIQCSSWTGLWINANLSDVTRSSNLFCSHMINPLNGYIGGIDGILLKTTNGGLNWTIIETGKNLAFKKIFFPGNVALANKGIALAIDGNIYKTTNGGNSWTQATGVGFYNDFHFYNVSTGLGIGVGNDGLITKFSYDLGTGAFKTAALNHKQLVTDDLYSVSFPNINTGLAVGENGGIYVITNASTLPLVYPVSGMPLTIFKKVYANSATLGAVIDQTGALYRVSISASLSGTPQKYPGTLTLLSSPGDVYIDLSFNTPNVFATRILANNATVTRYTASSITTVGATYSYIAGPDDGVVMSGQTFGSGNILLTGNNGTIAICASATWTNYSQKVKSTNLNTVSAVAATNQVWISGNDGKLFVSNNNAALFTQKITGVKYALKDMSFYATDNGNVKGTGKNYINITGAAVTDRTISANGNVEGLISSAMNEAYIFTSDNSKGILYTVNSGVSHSVVSGYGFRTSEKPVTATITASGNMMIMGSLGAFYTKSTMNVFSKSYNSPLALNGIDIKNQKGMVVGNSGAFLSTSNNGRIWNYQGQFAVAVSTYVNLNDVYVNKDGTAYVTANSGYAKKMNTDGSGATNLSFGTSPGSKNLKSIAFNEHGEGILTAEDRIYRKPSGSTTWSLVFTGPAGTMFNDAETQGKYAIVAGDNGKIYRSSDYNTPSPTFMLVSAPSGTTTSNFVAVAMYDRSRAYILGTGGAVIKTVDWGTNWVRKFSNISNTYSSSDIRAMVVNTRDQLVLAGNSNYITRVNDQADFISTMFWYDKLGRELLSQDTRQFNKPAKTYTYVMFDAIGRSIEGGEKASSTPIEDTKSGLQIDDALYLAWIAAGGSSTRTEVTMSFYDQQMAPGGILTQINLKGRISSVYYMDVHTGITSGATAGYQHATHYTYDVHGNVPQMVQDIPALSAVSNQYKYIDYLYDQVTGLVNKITYNQGQRDEFSHRFKYDSDRRIIMVETSHDGVLWDKDANYEYYLHAPLARTEFGDLKVQGMDFVYTIHGYVKGVNSNSMDPGRDVGKDGLTGGARQAIGKDAFGFSLNYYNGDYQSITSFSTSNNFIADITGSDFAGGMVNLYSGNINSMVTCLPKASDYNSTKTITPEAFGSTYAYDQLDRLMSSRIFTNINMSTNTWQNAAIVNPQPYASNYTYDAMGNILTQKRNGDGVAGPLALDDLIYNYHTDVNGLISNRLYSVNDPVSPTNYTDDIDAHTTFNNTHSSIETANNYGYDPMGNLIRDDKSEVASIAWNSKGKIMSVTHAGPSTKPDMEFGYDVFGHRLWKKVIPKNGDPVKTFYYLRDSKGKVMANYVQYINAISEPMFVLTEHPMYGKERIGVDNRMDTMYKNAVYNPAWHASDLPKRNLGLKAYELTNHLGNVMVTVSDKKVYTLGGMGVEFQPEITSISDYYPFGSSIQTRAYSSGAYRYGFNGKELDKDGGGMGGGGGSTYDYGFRIYNPDLGRFLSVDPLFMSFPWNSSYAFCENSPVRFVDLDGLEKATAAMYDQALAQIAAMKATLVTDEMSWVDGIKFLDVLNKLEEQIKYAKTTTAKGAGEEHSNNTTQDLGYYCGKAAAHNVLILYNPVGYVSLMIELFANGEAQFGDDGLKFTIPADLAGGGFGDPAKIVDEVFGRTVNAALPQGLLKKHLQEGNTVPWEYKALLKSLGLKVTESNFYKRHTNKDLELIQKNVADGFIPIIFENHGLTSTSKDDGMSGITGIHFITIHKFKVVGDYVEYTYWDYGTLTEGKKTIDEFLNGMKGYWLVETDTSVKVKTDECADESTNEGTNGTSGGTDECTDECTE